MQSCLSAPSAALRRVLVPTLIGASLLAMPFGVGRGSAHEADGHPARLHQGRRDDFGAVAFSLTGVGAAVTEDGTPIATPQAVGPAASIPIQISETHLDASLAQLTQTDYVIAIYDSDAEMRVIACGSVAGLMRAQTPGTIAPGDALVAGLASANGSNYSGFAIFQPTEGGDLDVTIYLAEGLAKVGATASPTAAETPVASTGGA